MTRRERLERRAERRRQWAESREATGDAARERHHEIADRIPFGQPILVGHHSERAARADQRRLEQLRGKAVENWSMAKRHEERAENLERQLRTSIYSDDVDAVERLRGKVERLEQRRDRIKAYNASCRRGAPDLELLSEREREEIASLQRFAHAREADGRFPAYALSNLGAEIRRNRQRLEQIQRDAERRERGDRGPGRPMLSRYAGTCADCGGDIERGSAILWYRVTREAVHAECPAGDELEGVA